MRDNGVVGYGKAFRELGPGAEVLDAFEVTCCHCGFTMVQCDPKCVARLKNWLIPPAVRTDIIHNCPKCKKQGDLQNNQYRFKVLNRKGREVRTRW